MLLYPATCNGECTHKHLKAASLRSYRKGGKKGGKGNGALNHFLLYCSNLLNALLWRGGSRWNAFITVRYTQAYFSLRGETCTTHTRKTRTKWKEEGEADGTDLSPPTNRAKERGRERRDVRTRYKY